MPSNYLLLRNNKQTGPHSLEALLQHNLQPHDLIWVNGHSAGWSYPHETESLKPFLGTQKTAAPAEPVLLQRNEQTKPAYTAPRDLANSTAHIYVSLPAGAAPRVIEEPLAPNLEAKAEALYQRVQAYTAGRTTEEADTRYARSLDDMKQEYGAWQAKQKQRKKTSISRKKLMVAASVLIVTTTGFGIAKWILNKPASTSPTVAGYTLENVAPVEKSQTTTVSYNPTSDSFTASVSKTTMQFGSVTTKTAAKKSRKKPVASKTANQTFIQSTTASPVFDTLQTSTAKPLATVKLPLVQPQAKKITPLSQLVFVHGALLDKNDKTRTQVGIRNNSSETLKMVAVTITYFKKESRQLHKETVYFYNVRPAANLETTANGNRRATSAHFEIATITRADGSLYLIH